MQLHGHLFIENEEEIRKEIGSTLEKTTFFKFSPRMSFFFPNYFINVVVVEMTHKTTMQLCKGSKCKP
jgi:hypothetical protein